MSWTLHIRSLIRILCIPALLFHTGLNLNGQETGEKAVRNLPVNRERFRIHASPVRSGIAIDGILDEEAWSKADRATDFYRILPIDTGYARAQT
ncbi:MAG: hypothetical protein R6U78_10335, partial [Bacteroidales bacterium]